MIRIPTFRNLLVQASHFTDEETPSAELAGNLLRGTEVLGNKINLDSSSQALTGSFHHLATHQANPALGSGRSFPSEQPAGEEGAPAESACGSPQLAAWLQERETERNTDKPKPTAPEEGADVWLPTASALRRRRP